MKQSSLDYNQITDDLFIGKTPAARDYSVLSKNGIELIINMRAERYALPTKTRKIIKTIWLPLLDSRFTPIRLHKINNAVNQANTVIADGGKVYVYCRAGRHRSVAMAAAILMSQGYDMQSAINLLKSKRLVADPEIPRVSKVITKFSQL